MPNLEQIDNSRIKYIKDRLTLENLDEILQEIMSWADKINFLSVDVDGMEGHLTIGLLERGVRPEVIVVEINRVYPPPLVFKQPYDANYVWDKSINSGWSLQAYVDELGKFGYKLVACNGHTGVNAFFVAGEVAHLFPDVPREVADIYIGRGTRHLKYEPGWLVADRNTASAIVRNES